MAIAAVVPRFLGIAASQLEEEFYESSAGMGQNINNNCKICECVLGQKLKLRTHIENRHGRNLCEHKRMHEVRHDAHDKRVHIW